MYASFRHENLDSMQITAGAEGKMVVHSNWEMEHRTKPSTTEGHVFYKKKNCESYVLIKMN